jgi:hypothetical protein
MREAQSDKADASAGFVGFCPVVAVRDRMAYPQ